ncbi:MAG: AI-2E family transporter, partial [Candidatus Spechtbacteria bacterium]|nr:AI-2E family transporter [Candidatus Spechtbacteria bacterium]
LQTQVQSFLQTIQFGFKGGVSNIFGFTSNVFGGLISFILVVVVSFYLVLQKNGIEQFLKSFLPAAHQEYATDLWKRVQERIGRWFQTQLLLGVFTGTFLFLALWLMGVKYALTIAFMAGVLEIVPVIGAVLTGFLTFALISFQSPMLALGAVLIYVALEQVQQHLFMPIFTSKALGLSPIVIIVALLVGSKLIGFWGILLAIPLAVAIGEVVRDFRK